MFKVYRSVMMRVQKHRRIVTYLLSGGLLFCIDFGTTVAVFRLFNVTAGLASAAGFMASFLIGFLLNKNLVFRHSKTSRFNTKVQITLYFSLALFNLFLTSSLVQLLVNRNVYIEVAKPIVVLAASCWNYIIMGKFIFVHSKNPGENVPVVPPIVQ